MSSLPPRLRQTCPSSGSSPPPLHSGTGCSSPEDEEEEKEFLQLHLFHNSFITNVSVLVGVHATGTKAHISIMNRKLSTVSEASISQSSAVHQN